MIARGFGGAVSIADGQGLSAFGSARVVSPVTLFATSQEYTPHPLLWEHVTASGGSATHSAVRNSTALSTAGTGSGARAIRQTKVYWRYQPGKGQRVKASCVPVSSGAISGAARVSWGYGDDNNGVFAGQDATGKYVELRSDVSGSVVKTRAYQSAWSGADRIDGLGDSGVTLDFTKDQLFVLDLEWLSVGRVRCGFEINGAIIYVHQFIASNVGAGAYMRTANLPIRYEVINDGGAGSNVTMEAICAGVESEGGVDDEGGYGFVASMGVTSVSCAQGSGATPTMIPLFSMRLVDTFGGITYRGHVHPTDIETQVATNSAYWQLRWNGSLTGATWASSPDATYSGAEVDLASTAISGGVVVAAGYWSAGQGSHSIGNQNSPVNKLILARTYANVRDTLTLCACGYGGASTISAAINYQEQY